MAEIYNHSWTLNDDYLIHWDSLVSILIVTYNAEKTIHWTLASIFDQTYKDYEILILDNNSSDSTLDVLREYEKKHKQIKIFSENKNLWPYKWLNYLLDRAKWKYIAIQDHDDIRYKEKIEKQVEFLENNKDYVWCWTWCLDYFSWDNTWYLIQEKEWDDYLVYHTSLAFRNGWYRYDISKTFMCDCYFMRFILCKNKKNLHVIPWIMTLHYNKKDWSNLSNHRFKLNWNNIKTYFKVYWYDLYHIFALIYIVFLKILPRKFQKKIQHTLLKKIKWLTEINQLNNEYLEDMLKYL